MKKLLSVALVVLLMLSIIPFSLTASAASPDCTYTFKDGVVTISGEGWVGSIPASIDDEKVVEIIIKEGPISIEEFAFQGLPNLESVTLPNSMRYLEGCTFEDCEKLAKINLPSSLQEFDSYDIYNTKIYNDQSNWDNGVLYLDNRLLEIKDHQTITEFKVKEGTVAIGGGVFYKAKKLKTVTIPKSVVSIGGSAFSYCESLVNFKAEGVTYLGEEVFRECKKLKSVKISDNATHIGLCAFFLCEKLADFSIPKSVTYIGEEAFKSCKSLKNVTIPEGVTKLEYGTFMNCTALENITAHDKISSIGENAFKNTGYYNTSSNWENDVLYIGSHLINVNNTISGDCKIKKGTTSIPMSAFSDCKNLKSVTIPEGVTKIKQGTFENCSKLKSVKLPSTLTTISFAAFKDCVNLEEIALPNSVTYIGEDAFAFCKNLKTVTTAGECKPDVNQKNKILDTGAFDSCKNLVSVSIPQAITELGNWVFSGCKKLEKIDMPDTITDIGFDVISDSALYKNESLWGSDVLYLGKHLMNIKNSVSGNFTVKKGTLSINGLAFSGNKKRFDNIIIPESVNSIYYTNYLANATTSITVDPYNKHYSSQDGVLFNNEGSSLIACPAYKTGDYTIPSGVTLIGDSAFQYCSLTGVRIPGSVEDIREFSFNSSIYLKKLTIDEGVKFISECAFDNCYNLENIVLPKSLKAIDHNAFSGCEKITNVYYNGSKADKKDLKINKSNRYLTAAEWHYLIEDEEVETNQPKALFSLPGLEDNAPQANAAPPAHDSDSADDESLEETTTTTTEEKYGYDPFFADVSEDDTTTTSKEKPSTNWILWIVLAVAVIGTASGAVVLFKNFKK